MTVPDAASMPDWKVREDMTELLRRWLSECDRVVVGIDTGFSVSAGMAFTGPRFEDNFSDFGRVLGTDRILYPKRSRFPTDGEFWAYWSRLVMLNRFNFEDNGTYAALRDVLRGREYFIISAAPDGCVRSFGFDRDRLFLPQGDLGSLQCPKCAVVRPGRDEVTRMCAAERDMSVPDHLLPRCPACGQMMVPHIRMDERFVQDDEWYAEAERFDDFMLRAQEGSPLFLELGVGPGMYSHITERFRSAVASNQAARRVSVGEFECNTPAFLFGRSTHIRDDPGRVLADIRRPSG